MKRTYGIISLIGIFILIIGATGAYAYTNNPGLGMIENNQGNYRGMMNNDVENYRGMVSFDNETITQMNDLHEKMIKNLDSKTAKQMDAMHDACRGIDDNDEQ